MAVPACRMVLMALLVSFLMAAPAMSLEVRVSTGGNDAGADGSAEKPFRTITSALALAGASDQPVTVLIESGVYNAAGGEKFPISLAPLAALAILGPQGGIASIEGSLEDALLEVTVAPGCPSIRMERLHFQGGLSGVTVVGQDHAVFEAAIEGSRFTGQRYQGLEVVAAAGGSATAVIRGNVVEGAPVYAIDLGTQRKGNLVLQVEDNRIEDPSPPPPPSPGTISAPTRYGVSVFVDLESSLTGRIDRNSISEFPVGMLIFTESFEGDPARMDLTIANCLITGRPAAERGRLRHGFYLGLRPVMKTGLRILHSTVVNASGFAVYQEEPADFTQAEEARVEIAGCIFANLLKGEFSAETGGRTLPAFYQIHHNILPADSKRTGDGNRPADPLLTAAHQPSEGSPAVDFLPGSTAPGETDLKGACRVADGDGDGLYRIDAGAIERMGACERDSHRFFRGDCDLNSALEITDPVRILNFLFLAGAHPTCPDACDANDDGAIDITDGIFALNFLYTAGNEPPAPFPGAGADPTADRLGECR